MPPQAVQLKQEGIHDDITIKDILEDMRSKMDKQTNTLETLARENERLKMTLQERSRLRGP
ncbi:hypothetical protein SERLA73DRAFT_147192 [Serpula lacrymans var. lacrymans S7.3]|uniref:Uncharacterized protein n=2 Tax=Serpula lacrymans var. lacrymans TaxID=341189 RepID=F8QGX7_SERL3|nr:uncharacterized protein SERLADRAFT_403837 [Serpula lacrymans var. lacrymans S7.9]EGN92459.1 hypothetical protein SERLA73DRAFT_147192 [Serpula lacrymans var. lacrymans S7.3]EGO18586.1 hypothetical protein SERLADRAFT_403837 [Serpula lacrymans var. lacrymans S7.9]